MRKKSSNKKDWNPVLGIQNPQREIRNPRLSWIPSHGKIKGTGNQVHFHWQFNFIGKGQPRHEPRFYVLFLDQTFMTLIFFQPPGQSRRVKPWLFGPLETVQTIRNWDVAKERLRLSFILSKGYKVKFLKSFAKNRMYLMTSWRNTLDWKLFHQKIRRRLL